ncbi:uncharacterized protein LOC108087865 [Drosophila ficusphila]|uniref:uncharacterized protein LOC108087865 n=1 Tax=Drosophila ficusphila TaxID=30025 RepID=UPI0007E7F9E3|nr:uncharacterized protein LOC108087865 [Drosophila ficusphila]
MSFNFYVEALNTTLQSIARQVEQFAGVALKAAVDLRGNLESITGDFRWENGPIAFTDLQATLLKVLLILLLGTCVLAGYSWSVYGQVITEKFVRPSTLKEIEELKLSVAKLKLPKEHSPRI